MSSKALLVIDMQKDLCYDLRRKHKVEQMIGPLKRAIDLFSSAGYPVFYICFSLPPDDEQFKRFGDRYCIEGTEGTEIVPELQPLKGIVIKKHKHSAFFETELDYHLKRANVEEIYLTGLQTHICIMTTAADAYFRGYRPIAISDCVLSTREKNKLNALDWISDYVGEVLPLSKIEMELSSASPSSLLRVEPEQRSAKENTVSVITLAHGDGGAATLRFIRDDILPRFDNPSLNALEDGSWVSLDNTNMVVSTDSYVVDPPIFPGGDIGKLAISGTVNDLLASGAIPRYLTFSLIISEGFPRSALNRILDSAQQTAQDADVKIVAGDTKVLGKQTTAGIYINTTGLGIPLNSGKDYAVSNAHPEDNIIVTGTLGDHGMAVLSAREGLGFEHRILSDCAPLQELMIPLLKICAEIHCLRDPTRGGVIGALIDIAESSQVDVFVNEDAIPLMNEVRFGCEMLGLDPLSLVNEGKMIVVVSAAETEKVLAQLRQHLLGKASNVIGVIQKAHAARGQLILKKGSARRVVVRPEGQTLPRLC